MKMSHENVTTFFFKTKIFVEVVFKKRKTVICTFVFAYNAINQVERNESNLLFIQHFYSIEKTNKPFY